MSGARSVCGSWDSAVWLSKPHSTASTAVGLEVTVILSGKACSSRQRREPPLRPVGEAGTSAAPSLSLVSWELVVQIFNVAKIS
ncbi:hypothetical protein X963_4521 [Burkholderia pseudomallei MSHR7498]|nr:hypothetical protein DP49_4426 [Burkholderia pseudomallei]KGR96359.1 hypothetical protein X948_4757 [Burkholderia pseudomallei MSHR5608]KGS38142.1 hypothetical protein X945_5008 [Burkholderia pseudomallei ABCPW 107]KGS93397.1 hypothetical protein X963_4521 [Burkholderia pseudomallei MSHR7498]KGX98304.1 hypothetical protein X997_4476 [Burkholderia pseudomallei A79C]